jgi:tetratricopeptide (TPR) repeat protein
MTYFAVALGTAHDGALDRSRTAIDALQRIADRLSAGHDAYWAEQVAIQRLGASGALAQASGKSAEALALLREATTREDATEKNAITPGPLAPARELLADLLMDMKDPAQALVEYKATLEKEPNRFRALYGAAKAAAATGDAATARRYFADLLRICEAADTPGRPELTEARAAVR